MTGGTDRTIPIAIAIAMNRATAARVARFRPVGAQLTGREPADSPCIPSDVLRHFSPIFTESSHARVFLPRDECLNKFVVVGEKHLNHINRQWQLHYNQERPHSARDYLPPDRDDDPPELATIRISDIVCHTRLGRLLKSYERRAAA